MPIDQRFEQLDATSREMLGYLSLAPVILTLDDMQKLLGSASRTATEITERVAALDDLLMESSAGYGSIHDSLRKQISERLMRHPQLNSLLTDRLSNLLADTGRSWAAFCLRRSEINERVARLANRAASEAVFTGSRRHLTETLEYLVVYYRSRSEKGRLVTVLLALAEVRANHGRASEAEVLLREARALTEQSADSEAEQMIDVLEALIDLRGSASATALARVRALRNKARADGQADLEGRLLLDEGVAYLGVNDTEASAPLFRRAREIFKNLDDVYGLEVATRNLIASLSITREGRAEAEALRASLDAEVSESPRYRAWLCNLDVPRLRIEKRYEEAQALAREAISIGIELGDDYLVAINQIVLGNVLRDARDFEGARTAYAKGSELGQSVGRRDIEGRSRRLLAAIDNQAAEAAIGKERLALAVRAEQNATHAADLLKESFAWIEQACALEERANALRLQDRDREAMSVYALAISGYSRGGDVTEVERLMHFFVNYISDEPDSMALIARAFDGRNDLTASSAWVEALSVTLSRCPKSVAPSVLGCMIQAFLPHHSGAFWFDCLIRSLFAVDGKWRRNQHSSIGSILLLTILGFGRHRKFNTSELLTLAGICLSGADHTIVRHRPGGDFHLVIHLGAMRRLLFTVRTEIRKPESMFVALVIGSFLDAFSNEVSEILSPDVLENGAAIDVIVFSQGGGSRTVENFFHEGLKDKPVATARINAEEGEEAPIIIIARADAIEALEAGNQRGGELEIMLARFLDEVIFATTGRSIDDEIFSKKVRDLLMSVLG